MIERYQLRYFLAVVDAGNFSRAAAQVNVSQPALSVAIAKLEEALGAKLFWRNSQRVHLTAEGTRLLSYARDIESDFNALKAKVSYDRPRPVVRVGVLSTIPTSLIQKIVRANAAADAPDAIEFVEGVERDLLGRLQRGRIDVALTLLRSREARFPHESLFREGYSLLAARDHPLAGQDCAPGEAFAGDTMIVRRHCEVLSDLSRYFTERGVRPRFSFRSTNDDRVRELVCAGLGVTVMPDSYVNGDVAAFKLANFGREREIGLLFAQDEMKDSASPVLSALRSLGSKASPG